MPPEQRAYHAQALRRLVIEQDILAWIYSQLEDLAATVGGSLVRA